MSGRGGGAARPGIRLQKVLAAAGAGSRRHCEELIATGRVRVDGEVVTEMGTRIDPDRATVHVDGQRLVVASGVVVLALNKPAGVITAMRDARGARCVGDLIPNEQRQGGRLFHVGRLDADTEGLLLLTNDGDLAHRLTHPSFGVIKRYVADVRPAMDAKAMRRLRQGVAIDGRSVVTERVKIIGRGEGRTVIDLSIHEGRNRVIRRVFERLGRDVVALVRTEFGPVRLGRLRSGQARRLTPRELDALYSAADAASEGASSSRSRSM